MANRGPQLPANQDSVPVPPNTPTNNKDANDLAWMEKILSATELLSNTSIKGAVDLSNFITGKETDLMDMLKIMTEEIDKPILKSLANDLIGVLGSFYVSEEMLCCLIKNLLVTIGLEDKIVDFNKWIHDLRDNSNDPAINGLHINADNFTYIVSETKFARIIDVFILVIDIILTFINLDFGDIIFPNLDIIQEISEAVVGFLCIAIQEIIFTLRDAGINWIIAKVSEVQADSSWAKCLPFMDFIEILKKYIHDYGLAKKLSDLIQGFIGKWIMKFKKRVNRDMPKNIKMCQFLNYIKMILTKIKEAVISWEYCAFLGQEPNEQLNSGTNPYYNYLDNLFRNGTGNNNISSPNYKIADNDTILMNNDDGANTRGNGQNSLNVSSNDEIRAFLINYMGLTPNKADTLLGDGGLNTENGNGNENSCGNILNPSDITSIFNQIIEQSRMG